MEELKIGDDEQEQIDICVSCTGLPVQNTQIEFHTRNAEKEWINIGISEVVNDNQNPSYVYSFQLEYVFQILQPSRIEVYEMEKETGKRIQKIGQGQFTISKLMGHQKQCLTIDVKNEKLEVIAKMELIAYKVPEKDTDLIIKPMFKDLIFQNEVQSGGPVISVQFSRIDTQTSKQIVSCSTNIVKGMTIASFDEIKVQTHQFADSNYHQMIYAQIFESSDKKNSLGVAEFTLQDVLDKGQLEFKFINSGLKKVTGMLLFEYFRLNQKNNFTDFIRAGVQLNLICAIDFTGSNGQIENPASLHFDGKNNNDYQEALTSVGEVLINYDYDQLIPVYGYGAKLQESQTPTITNHCFALNFNQENPEVSGLEGLMECYQKSLQKLMFDGPTLFQPVIARAIENAIESKQKNMPNYFILLILTDGAIHDMNQTISSIVDASQLPLSIIIVGVGSNQTQFKQMVILDGDEGLIDLQRNLTAERDLVQFVKFKDYKGNGEQLAKAVLQELPDQLTQYMELVGLTPENFFPQK